MTGAVDRLLTLDEQAAVLVVRDLALHPDTVLVAVALLRSIELGQRDEDDETWLPRVLSQAGATVTADEARGEWDRALFRDGKPVRLPPNPCPKALRLIDNSEDPDRKRPCMRWEGAGHEGSCTFADVPAADQRATMAQFKAEVAAVERALREGDPSLH
jgi:hypothetical protein